MKNIKLLILAFLSCLFCLFAVACNKIIEFDYNIDFVVDGKVIASVGTNGDKIAMPKNPTKEDYTFDGWYWDEGEWDDEFTLNSILDQPLQDENRYKVYAKFKSSVYYTVIFYESGEEIRQQIKHGEPTALRLNTFECTWSDDTVFAGWIDSNDNVYQDGEIVLNICEVGEEIYLMPNWKYDFGSYTVVFKPNGGEGSMSNQTVPRNESAELSKNTFARAHFNFVGWNTTADRVGFSYEDGDRVYNLGEKNETVTLYAQWEYNDEYGDDEPIVGNTYTIRYVENNGTTLYEKTMSVGVDGLIYCMAYRAPDSYEFIGWNMKADGTGRLFENGAYLTDVGAGETVVLYAQYKKMENESIGGIYYVDDYADLLLMKNDLSGTYVLIQDVELPSNTMWSNNYECGTPSNPFNGKFFGNGYTIFGGLYNHSYQKEVYCGLFGYIGESGWVQDLHLELWIDTWDYSATFARYNKGTIVNCSAAGTVAALENEFQRKELYVGGIVVFNEGTIKNTLSTVFMSGTTLTKNIQMGGICVKNSGTVENCIYLRRNEYDSIGGYKYSDNTSFQIDGLMCVNEGLSTNNYYFNMMDYAVHKGNSDVGEIYESGKVTSFYGKGADASQINDKAFYVGTLGWSEDIWSFSKLNYNNGEYPILKEQ